MCPTLQSDPFMPTRDRFRRKVEEYENESCLQSVGSSFIWYPLKLPTSVFQRKYPSWRSLLPISTELKNMPLKASMDFVLAVKLFSSQKKWHMYLFSFPHLSVLPHLLQWPPKHIFGVHCKIINTWSCFFFFLSKTCDWITQIPKRIAWRVFAKTEFYELISRVSRENDIERSTLLKLWKAGEHNWSSLSRAGENRDVDSQWTQEKEKKCTSHKTFFITNKIFVTPRGV